MSMTTLLHCPFCGQQPTEYAIEPHTHVLQFAGGKMPDHQGSHVIECACGCGMIEATREAAVAVWNRRPTPAAVCEVMGLVQDYFVTGTDEARDTIESKLRTLLATSREAQAQQPAIMPKGKSAAAQLRAMATNYPTGHCWDKLDAKACIRGALEIEALRALQATATGLPAQAVEPHPDDVAVDALAALMKAKLAKQRGKGYGGWDTDCTQQRLSELLRDHVEKGDPVDVANFCAFLSARGEGIEADARDAVTQAVRDYYFALDTRQHGGAAASTALDAIQKALGLNWVQGAEASARAAIAAAKGE